MAYPTIHGIIKSDTSPGTGTHNINLPASMQNGSLLVLFVSNGTSEAPTGLSAYTEKNAITNTGWRGVYVKQVDGSEGTQLALSVTTSSKFAAIAFEVRGWRGSSLVNDIALAYNTFTGTDAFPQASPTLTPSWGAEDTLWLAAYQGDSNNTVVTPPASPYTLVETQVTGITSGAAISVYSRTLNATSETPSSWTMSNQRVGATYTIGIRPTSATVSVSTVSDTTLDNGQSAITITGTTFGATQGTGKVYISPTNNVADGSRVEQTVNAWGDTSINMTAVRGALAHSTNLYLFVLNDSGGSNATGYTVQFNAVKKLKLLVHPSAASATDIQGIVFLAPTGGAVAGNEVGEFANQTFEASLESGQAVLKVVATAFGGGSLAVGSTPVVLAKNSTNTTGIVSATIIEE